MGHAHGKVVVKENSKEVDNQEANQHGIISKHNERINRIFIAAGIVSRNSVDDEQHRDHSKNAPESLHAHNKQRRRFHLCEEDLLDHNLKKLITILLH